MSEVREGRHLASFVSLVLGSRVLFPTITHLIVAPPKVGKDFRYWSAKNNYNVEVLPEFILTNACGITRLHAKDKHVSQREDLVKREDKARHGWWHYYDS